jgi:hypothetical protein
MLSFFSYLKKYFYSSLQSILTMVSFSEKRSSTIMTEDSARLYASERRARGVPDDFIRAELLKQGLDLLFVDKLLKKEKKASENDENATFSDKLLFFLLKNYIGIVLFILFIALIFCAILIPVLFVVAFPFILILVVDGLGFGGLISIFSNLHSSRDNAGRKSFKTNFLVGLAIGIYLLALGAKPNVFLFILLIALPVFLLFIFMYNLAYDEALPLVLFMTLAAFIFKYGGAWAFVQLTRMLSELFGVALPTVL